MLFSPAFIFIPYLKTLLLTCIIKVGPLSVTMAWAWIFLDFSNPQSAHFSSEDVRSADFKESENSAWAMHFSFLPLDGVKLFPTAGICLLSATSSPSTQISKMHHGPLQTNEVLSCKSVIILWGAEGVIVQTVPVWGFAGSVDVSALWWQKSQSVFSVSVPSGQLSKSHKTDKHYCLSCIKECELWHFSKRPFSVSGYTHTMIYGLDIKGL